MPCMTDSAVSLIRPVSGEDKEEKCLLFCAIPHPLNKKEKGDRMWESMAGGKALEL